MESARAEWNRQNPERQNWDRQDWNRQDWNRSNWNQSRDYQSSNWRRPEQWDSGRGTEYMRDRGWDAASIGGDWDRNRGSRSDENAWPYGNRESYESRLNRPSREWSLDDGRTEFGQQRYGRGPKGYQRTDARIHEDVCDRLTYSDVDAENIEVRVQGGEVTLSGSVRDRWDKRRAEDVAEEVSGVRDVHNNIRVNRGERGIGQSETSASDQPGTVLGVNPTASSTITNTPPKGTTRS
jgi:hypothetical protein